VGQGTPLIKSGRGARSKIGPKIRRTLPSHGFFVTSNLQNTTHKHKERTDQPRKRAETATNGKHKQAATASRHNRRKITLKVQGYLQGCPKDTTKGVQGYLQGCPKDTTKGVKGYLQGFAKDTTKGVKGYLQGFERDTTNRLQGYYIRKTLRTQREQTIASKVSIGTDQRKGKNTHQQSAEGRGKTAQSRDLYRRSG